jgi:hypothetical protein
LSQRRRTRRCVKDVSAQISSYSLGVGDGTERTWHWPYSPRALQRPFYCGTLDWSRRRHRTGKKDGKRGSKPEGRIEYQIHWKSRTKPKSVREIGAVNQNVRLAAVSGAQV